MIFILSMVSILLVSVTYAGLHFGMKGAVKKQTKKVDEKVREEKETEEEFRQVKEELQDTKEELREAEQEKASGNANVEDVKAGKTFSKTGSVGLTGTMPTQTLSAATETVNAGYYEAITLSAVDANLAAGNVKKDVVIFGITGTSTGAVSGSAVEADVFNSKTADVDGDGVLETGTLNLAGNIATFDGATNLIPDAYDGAGDGTNRWVMKETGDALAADLKSGTTAWVDGVEILGTKDFHELPDTGQGDSYTGTWGEDNDYEPVDTQPSYTNNGDGTITDNRTGLMWLADANDYNSGNPQSWEAALSGCESFSYATYSDWRLPNVRELMSIVDYGESFPAINTAYFLNTTSYNFYWTSTTFVPTTTYAWGVIFDTGNVQHPDGNKTNNRNVRPVRGGP